MSRVRPLRGPLRALDTAPAARPRKSFPRRSSEEKRPPYDSGPFFLLGLRPTRASGARRASRSAPAALALRAEPRVGLRALRRAPALRGGAIPTRRARAAQRERCAADAHKRAANRGPNGQARHPSGRQRKRAGSTCPFFHVSLHIKCIIAVSTADICSYSTRRRSISAAVSCSLMLARYCSCRSRALSR